MNRKGFLWTMELLLGLLALAGLWGAGMQHASHAPTTLPITICNDLAAIHTYPNGDVEKMIEAFYGGTPIDISSIPFLIKKENSVTCMAERFEKGVRKTIFIRIQRE